MKIYQSASNRVIISAGFSLMWVDGGSPTPTSQKFAHPPKWKNYLPPPPQIFILSSPKGNFPLSNYIKIFKLQPNENVIFSCSHYSCTIFVLISYSFDTQVMLILILIDVQHSQNGVFYFEKGLNHQNRSSSGSHHHLKKSPQQNFQYPLHPIPLFGKHWSGDLNDSYDLIIFSI